MLGNLDVSQPPPVRSHTLAEIAPGLTQHRSLELGFEIGWPPAGWQAAVDPFQLMGLQAQFGVPPVVGAKKWLPNFNEYTLRTDLQLTRKLEKAIQEARDPAERRKVESG